MSHMDNNVANDDEDWNNSRIKPFNFADIDETASELAKLREGVGSFNADVASVYSNESDSIDVTNFTDSASVRYYSSEPRFPVISSPTPKHGTASSSPVPTPNLTVKSHHRNDSATSSTGGLSFTVDEISPFFGSKSVDYNRLESEYNKLKLKFEQMRRDKYRPADVGDTVRRLMNCEPCSLEPYKSKKDKLSLLSAAIDLADGSVIIAVLLFLRQTLSYALFQEQLLQNPVVANHYVTYLRDHFKYDELITTLFSIGRKEEAAIIEFNQAAKKRDPTTKMQHIKKSIQSTFSIDANLNNECRLAVEYCDLLERQLPIEAADAKVIAENKDSACKIFRVYPKTASVIDQPLLTTLYYCCLYHYELPINSSSSPLHIRAHYQLTDKQYCWVAVKCLARQKRWLEIEKLLTNKNFFGATKLKSPVAYDKLLSILAQQGATPEVLSIYVRQVNDSDKKLELAEKFKCHQVVVDCHVAAKDRLALINYRAKLSSRTPEAHYADSAIQNSNMKWKN